MERMTKFNVALLLNLVTQMPVPLFERNVSAAGVLDISSVRLRASSEAELCPRSLLCVSRGDTRARADRETVSYTLPDRPLFRQFGRLLGERERERVREREKGHKSGDECYGRHHCSARFSPPRSISPAAAAALGTSSKEGQFTAEIVRAGAHAEKEKEKRKEK